VSELKSCKVIWGKSNIIVEMNSGKGYHKLIICDKARILVKEIYLLTEKFPQAEIFGLTSQIRRAAVSVLLKIVEGQRRNSHKDFLRFLDTAD
jgi:hypothetical protein